MIGKDTPPEVGKATQFKPGESGNPAGKPKGTKHINTWVQELLHDDEFQAWISDARTGVKEYKGAPIKAIIKAQIIKAVNGDTKAYDSLVKSGWVQKQEIDQNISGSLDTGIQDPQLAADFATYLKQKKD